jgi:hypothetical protein
MKDKKHIKSFNEATENLNISDVSDSKLYTRSEVIKLIQDFYIDKNKWDYNNDQPTKLNIDYMNNEVEKWMENK